ncbi:MAG TPA: protein translocase subunit SecD [Tepidisphaeraceae bacterium]|jgi:SecD/SecF fusion protein|nr:protein translocase subunit SecD [Tepidisphaeraceae bacterium]
MPKNYTGRISLILLVLALALWAIFPKGDFKHPNLRPGIDMVGGTSLLYQIKPPAAGAVPPDLAVQVMESLKKRVDPQGVRNLIWRPQGNTRIEIQMPMNKHNEKASQIREDFGQAQRQLDETNVRPAAVVDAIENLKGDARTKRLNDLAMGSANRLKLFQELTSTYDALAAARAAKNVEQDVQLSQKYEDLQGKIEDTNVSIRNLQDDLDLKPESRDPKIAAIKAEGAGFPARLTAIDNFDQKYVAYAQVKNSIDDAAELKRLLKGSGVLEFHILVEDYTSPEAQMMVHRLAKSGPVVQSGDNMHWYQIDHPEDWHQQQFAYNDKQYALAYTTPGKSMVNGPGITRWSLQKSYPTQDQNGGQSVGFEFDPVGAMYFSELTGNNINHPLASILDDRIITAPNINSRIGASGIITGNFSSDELRYMISTLNAGSLPAQLSEEPISERTVGPQLGAENLRYGLYSCLFGLLVVAVFLAIYYHLSGLVALVALIINIVLILGVMSMLEATWTLPAVAGIVLTIGIAVDANVLIFERLREEIHRGLSLPMAMRNAYDRAFSAIIDSNVTTAITCVVLIMLGSEEVKGFGLTLLLGLVSSLFTALYVTKTIFGIWIEYFGLKHLGSLPQTLPALERALKPHIDWMGKVWMFVTLSVVLLVLGMAALVAKTRQGEMFDIEFASGTSVQFELIKPLPQPEVEKEMQSIDEATLPSPSVVSVGTESREYEVVTPNPNAAQVRQAIINKFGDRLKIERPSTFEAAGQTIEQALDANVVIPIPDDGKLPTGVGAPADIASYHGGVAIVLKNISPPLAPDEIKRRIDRQQLQPAAGGQTPRYRDFEVYSTAGEDRPTTTATIVLSDPAVIYSADALKWREELSGPMWRLINEAIGRPPSLQKVTNFDAQVAGDAQRDALTALILANLIIMAYIWLRFGTLKYGAATVVAMIHDTLMVLGFIALSHYVGKTAIGHALLVEPFRINLTLVAAVLTIMGYSMVDTIVVFDRIRENRGKVGHLSRRIVNDSINQTLSRTLLTAGATLLTTTTMYIAGGPAIHGFAFVLLTGILIGTYSSIAIAAPLILVGGDVKSDGNERGLSRANPSAV